jgi:hypothetical protein
MLRASAARVTNVAAAAAAASSNSTLLFVLQPFRSNAPFFMLQTPDDAAPSGNEEGCRH